MAQQVSLTIELIDDLIALFRSLAEATTPPDLPPMDERNKGLWRQVMNAAKKELKDALEKRSKTAVARPGGRRRVRPSASEARKVKERLNERVRGIAERKYRELDPVLAAAVAAKAKAAREIVAKLSDLLAWHRPALERMSRCRRPGDMWWLLYFPAMQPSAENHGFRDAAIQDLLSIRLRLERQEQGNGQVSNSLEAASTGSPRPTEGRIMANVTYPKLMKATALALRAWSQSEPDERILPRYEYLRSELGYLASLTEPLKHIEIILQFLQWRRRPEAAASIRKKLSSLEESARKLDEMEREKQQVPVLGVMAMKSEALELARHLQHIADLAKHDKGGVAGAGADAVAQDAPKKQDSSTLANSTGSRKSTEPLTDKAAAVLELLKALPADRGMKGPDILAALEERKPRMIFDQSTLTKRVIPQLKRYGVTNRRGVGYYIDPSMRRNDATSTQA